MSEPTNNKIYSSIKDVLLEQQQRAATARNRRASSCEGGTQSLELRRISEADTRMSSFNTSFGSIDEDSPTCFTVAVERFCLSSSPPPPQEIDLSEMSSEDIQRLKVEDPFMYYSIPAVHSRSYRFDESSAADIVAQVAEGGGGLGEDDGRQEGEEEEMGEDRQEEQEGAATPPVNAATSRTRRIETSRSCPAGMLANAEIARAAFEQDQQQQRNVVKRRRISVEAHPSLICEDMMLHILTETSDTERMAEEEWFLNALMTNTMGEEDAE